MVPAHVWCLLLFSLVLLAGFCFLLFAPCFLLPSLRFCCFCFLLSALYRFCFLLVAFGLMHFAFCVLFLLFAFCCLLFACMCFGQTATRRQQNYYYYYATITMTLTKDSHDSNLYGIFVVTNTSTGAIISSNFPVTNERTSRNNKRFPCYTTIIISITHRYF